jgi:hypothetical protein
MNADPGPGGQLITDPPDLDGGTDPQHCRKMEKALNSYIEDIRCSVSA